MKRRRNKLTSHKKRQRKGRRRILLTSDLCCRLANLHCQSSCFGASERFLTEAVSSMSLPQIPYNNKRVKTINECFNTIKLYLETLFPDVLTPLILSYASMSVEILDADILASMANHFLFSFSSWFFKIAQEVGPSNMLIESMFTYGIRCDQKGFRFLAQEFFRLGGFIAFEFFLSKCSPLENLLKLMHIDIRLLLEVINIGLETLDLVETRCTSERLCLCNSFQQKREEIKIEDILRLRALT